MGVFLVGLKLLVHRNAKSKHDLLLIVQDLFVHTPDTEDNGETKGKKKERANTDQPRMRTETEHRREYDSHKRASTQIERLLFIGKHGNSR